jgi:hypothetical protein
MSSETPAVDGASPAAPVETVAPATTEQETPQVPATAEGSDPAERERDEKGRFKPTAQDRINELTRARREAERERDLLRAQLAQGQPNPQTKPTAASDKPPSLEDFDYDIAAFGHAMTEYAVKQAEQRVEARFREQNTHQTQAQLAAQFAERERSYAVAHPDYADSVSALASTATFGDEVLEVLAGSEHAPAVVHYLGKHLDEAEALSRMSPAKAAFELARIEAKVTAPKPKPPVSNAPTPPPTLSGGSVVQKDPDRMTTAEWLAWRRSQLKTS